MPRCLAITPSPDHTDSFIICVNVVACNHLMLSLIKAGRRHTTVETLSHSLPRPKTDGMFAPQISGITDAKIRLPKTIQLCYGCISQVVYKANSASERLSIRDAHVNPAPATDHPSESARIFASHPTSHAILPDKLFPSSILIRTHRPSPVSPSLIIYHLPFP